MNDVPVVLKDMPAGVRGFICLGSDYEPIIVLNSRLPKETQCRTYRHELKHLTSGEMFKEDYHEYGGA